MNKTWRVFFYFIFFVFASPVFAYDMCRAEGLDQCQIHSRVISACLDSVIGSMPPNKQDEIKICHSQYLVSANIKTKAPDWVAYHLSSGQIGYQDSTGRKDFFCPDPCLKPGQRAELSDYKGLYPDYNRGHMDAARDNKWDANAYKESYFLSNMLPQNPKNNGGIWLQLEDNVDAWTKLYGDLYIIAGPVYDYNGVKHQEVGANKVWAPAALFKIIYAPGKQQVLSFIIPNTNLEASSLSSYLTNIDTINKLTGLNLFAELPPTLKSKTATELWPLS